MPLKPCIVCGKRSTGPRCPIHALPRTRPNWQRRPDYTWAEAQRRKEAVDAHRAEYGNWCPGWAHQPPHPVTPPNILTADHTDPVGTGGAEDGALTVLCRSCNSSRGAQRITP